MLRPGSQIESFQRVPWNRMRPFLLFVLFFFVVCMKCARIGDPTRFIGALPVSAGFSRGREIQLQQAEGTETPSSTSSVTETNSITTVTATATLIPFPTPRLTLPSTTPTPDLYYLEHQDGSTTLLKGKGSFFARNKPYWLLILIAAIWGIIGVWFVMVQVLDRRR